MIRLYIILLSLLFCISAYGKQDLKQILDINIKKVDMLVNEDTDELDVEINIKNCGREIVDWQLGFYMPGTTFLKMSTETKDFNPNLSTEICDSKKTCQNLIYQKNNSINDNDLSQGYTAIFKPSGKYPLIKNETYVIKLLRSNFWGLGNVSYLPQNFFIIINGKEGKNNSVVHPLSTSRKTYNLHGYNQDEVDLIIANHITSNWEKSAPNIPTTHHVIPHPANITVNNKKYYTIPKKIIVNVPHTLGNAELASLSNIIAEHKDRVAITSTDQIDNADIILRYIKSFDIIDHNPEGYTIDVTSKNIIIEAATNSGFFYAIQTLQQLFHGNIKIPNVSIIDYPKFRYRGIMLDVVRHYFSISELEQFIKVMAAHKLNTLRLHLADDEAFRLDIEEYPSLKSIGSRRGLGLPMGPTMLAQGNLQIDGGYNAITADTEYGISYNYNEIRKIIDFANSHHITVIPEIDFPAHSRALIKSLPEEMIDPEDTSIYVSEQGYTDDVIPVCKYNSDTSIGPRFTKAIDTIVQRVATMFNNQNTVYAIQNEVSIGGDEVIADAWTLSKSCINQWQGLSATEKSHKFFSMMADANRDLIFSGWQQFVQTNSGNLGQEVVPHDRSGHVWVWSDANLGIKQAITLSQDGYPTVLAFSDQTYFDITYSIDIGEPGLNWASKWGDTYAALSISKSAASAVENASTYGRNNIYGIEAAIWTETIPTYEQLIYMAVPKMAGLAEAGWSPSHVTVYSEKINWQNLATRLGDGKKGFLAYLHDKLKVVYRGYPYGISLEVPTN